MEPLLGHVALDLRDWSVYDPKMHRIDWVIVGGESGKGARPMNPAWARSLRDQCKNFKTPFFFKQWGEFYPYQDETTYGRNSVLIDNKFYYPTGKKTAGSLLDGKEYKEFP